MTVAEQLLIDSELDHHAAELVRMVAARRHELAERVVSRLQLEIPTYAALPAETVTAQFEFCADVVSDLLARGGEGRAELLAVFSQLSRDRVEDGVSTALLVRAIRISAREAMALAQDLAVEAGVDATATLQLTSALWELVELIADHLQPSDPEIQDRQARNAAVRRFVKSCIDGTASPTELAEAAQACGLDPEARYCVARAAVDDPTTARFLSDLLRPHRPALGVAVDLGGEVVALLTTQPTAPLRHALGVGPLVPLNLVRRSYLVAGRVLGMAVRVGLTGPVTLDGVGLTPAVIEDSDLGEMLTDKYLVRLRALGDWGDELLDSVRQYFNASLAVDDAARRMHVHANTLRHRLARFEEVTGCNLRDPATIAEIWWLLTRLRLDPASA